MQSSACAVGKAPVAVPTNIHCTYSSAREKLLETLFLAELRRVLWLRKIHDVEVLRPEVDRNGFEFILGCRRIRRSVQLKTSIKDGKAAEVTVNRRLAEEPSGCVIRMFFDEATLKLGPFLWLDLQPGKTLQGLGEKVARNTGKQGWD